MSSHIETANAKINLGLKVIGKRADGFHDILSLLQTVDLRDDVELELTGRRGQTSVVCDTEDVPDGPANLAYRAVDAFRSATRFDEGVRIRLTKRIPAGGGLGGGSSDAAAVLRGLSRRLPEPVAQHKLLSLAAELGSDVPFFICGGAAVAAGRGEILTPVGWPDRFYYLLVDPGFRVSTATAFRRVRIGLTGTSEYTKLINSRVESDPVWPDALLAHLENDFLPLVTAEHPPVADILSVFRASDALGHSLSGTGATLFGVFRTAEASTSAADAIETLGYRCYKCRAMPGHPESDV